jgi:acetyl/propionyl-CoA carboxylase alpha subunit
VREPGYSEIGASRATHNGAAKGDWKDLAAGAANKRRALTSPGIGVIITEREIYQFPSELLAGASISSVRSVSPETIMSGAHSPVRTSRSVASGSSRRVGLHSGAPVAMIEAMKMESTITTPVGGRVARVVATTGTRVEQGDLLLVIA